MTDTEQGDVEKVARIIDPRSWSRFDCCYPFAANIPREQGIAWTIELQSSLTRAREIIAALKASPPEGWVMVPVEPTEGMAFAGGEQLVQQYCDNRQWDAAKDAIEGIDATEVYRAMLSASPVKASAPLQGDQLAKLRSALEAAQKADDLLAEADEMSERSVGEGWDNDPTGSSHVTSAYTRAQTARAEAVQLRTEAISATGEE